MSNGSECNGCGDTVRPEEAARLIMESLEASDSSVIELRRGLLETGAAHCVKS